MTRRMRLLAFLCLVVAGLPTPTQAGEMPWVAVSKDKKGFILEPSGKKFTPWGFNYDHDEKGRLLEDYWESEWEKVERDFRAMKALGANVVRIHLQLGRFLDGPDTANEEPLDHPGSISLSASPPTPWPCGR